MEKKQFHFIDTDHDEPISLSHYLVLSIHIFSPKCHNYKLSNVNFLTGFIA